MDPSGEAEIVWGISLLSVPAILHRGLTLPVVSVLLIDIGLLRRRVGQGWTLESAAEEG